MDCINNENLLNELKKQNDIISKQLKNLGDVND